MVGVEVGLQVPAVDHAGGQHRGVLARAVHQYRGCGAVGREHVVTGGVVERQVRGVRSASSVRPTCWRIRRTPSTCAGSPECDAQASASRSGGRSSPARSIPSACRGLRHERGSTARPTSRTDQSTLPSAASATTPRSGGPPPSRMHDLGHDGVRHARHRVRGPRACTRLRAGLRP